MIFSFSLKCILVHGIHRKFRHPFSTPFLLVLICFSVSLSTIHFSSFVKGLSFLQLILYLAFTTNVFFCKKHLELLKFIYHAWAPIPPKHSICFVFMSSISSNTYAVEGLLFMFQYQTICCLINVLIIMLGSHERQSSWLLSICTQQDHHMRIM